jgi:hypothetical protein
MSDARIDPLDPEIRDLFDADREIPQVPAEVRERLSARLETSRRRDEAWRGPTDASVDELSARRKWARRGLIAAAVALAASIALALVLGRTSAHRERARNHGNDRPTPTRKTAGPDHRMPQPAAARAKARKRRALRMQMVDSGKTAAALMDFVATDTVAQKRKVFVDRDSWVLSGGVGVQRTDRYLRTDAKGVGPCTWTITTGKPDANGKCALSGKEVLQAYLRDLYKRRPDLEPGTDRDIVFEEVTGPARNFWRSYLVHKQAVIDGTHVKKASVTWNPTTNHPEVLVEFDAIGTKRFAKATGASIGKKLAIVVQGEVVSAPIIQAAITGGRTVITMGGTNVKEIQREAQDLVDALRGRPQP